MAREDETTIKFNPYFFDRILRNSAIDNLSRQKAERALAIAQASAPQDSGDYRRGLRVKVHHSRYRDSWRVVATDPKSLLIESKTGNLARALKATR